jgi:hypothetical protein
MPGLDEIRESIDVRIEQLKNEIAALHAARVVLQARPPTASAAVSSTRAAKPRRRRTLKTGPNGHGAAVGFEAASDSPVNPPAATGAKVVAARAGQSKARARADATPGRRRSPKAVSDGRAVESGPDGASGSAVNGPAVRAEKVTAKRAGRAKKSGKKGVEVLLGGALEAMLREAVDGLSAIAISKRSNVAYGEVIELLRQGERAGRIRRTGSRRTSLWRLISDEEWIAERAAELERQNVATPGSSGGEH